MDALTRRSHGPNFDEVVKGCPIPLPRLGRLQKRLVEGLTQGMALRDIANALDVPVKELARVGADLARRLAVGEAMPEQIDNGGEFPPTDSI